MKMRKVAWGALMFGMALHAKSFDLRIEVVSGDWTGPLEPGVRVESDGSEGPVVTGDRDPVVLRFAGDLLSDSVTVKISKPGYEVVNGFELKVSLPLKDGSRPIRFLVTPNEAKSENNMRYFRYLGKRLVDSMCAEKQAEAKSVNSQAVAGTAVDDNNCGKVRFIINRNAWLVSGPDWAAQPDNYVQALRLLSSGDGESALKLLAGERVRTATVGESTETEERVPVRMLEAWLLIASLRSDEALRAYRIATNDYPRSFGAYFSYGYYLHLLGRYPEAETVYTRALRIAREDAENAELNEVLQNLVKVLVAQNKMPAALSNSVQAIKISRILATNQSSELAENLVQQSVIDSALGKHEEASQDRSEALAIRRHLAAKDPTRYGPALAASLVWEGKSAQAAGKGEEAQSMLREAVEIYRHAYERDSDLLRAMYGGALTELGNVDFASGLLYEARKNFDDSLEILQGGTKPSSDEVTTQYSAALISSARIDIYQNRPDEGKSQLDAAIQIRRILLKKGAMTAPAVLSEPLIILGGLEKSMNRSGAARHAYAEALDVLRSTDALNTSALHSTIAAVLGEIGLIDMEDLRRKESRQELEEALQIAKGLEATEPRMHRPLLASILGYLGQLERLERKAAESRLRFSESLDIYKELDKDIGSTDISKYSPLIDRSLENLVGLGMSGRPPNASWELARTNLAELLSLRRRKPDSESIVARTLVRLAYVDTQLGRFSDADKEATEAVMRCRALVERDRDRFLPNLAQALDRLADVHYVQKRANESRKFWKEELKVLREIQSKKPSEALDAVADVERLLARTSLVDRFRLRMPVEESLFLLGISFLFGGWYWLLRYRSERWTELLDSILVLRRYYATPSGQSIRRFERSRFFRLIVLGMAVFSFLFVLAVVVAVMVAA